MVCSPHRNQLAGIGYLATINAYRDMPIATPQFQSSYSPATPPQFGYRNQFTSSDLSSKVAQYKQFQDDSKAYQLQRIYIREYITQSPAPFGYIPPTQETPFNGGQKEDQRAGPNKSLDSILQNTTKKTSQQSTAPTFTATYRSEIEYNPRPSTKTQSTTLSEPQEIPKPQLRDKIKESLQQLLNQVTPEEQNNAHSDKIQLKPMRGLLYV